VRHHRQARDLSGAWFGLGCLSRFDKNGGHAQHKDFNQGFD
jgi:hypothetical protein